METRTAVLLALALQACVLTCSAAALAPSKPTDDSVCDLSPATTALLGRKTFISASQTASAQAAGYRRLAAVFVADHCGLGQTLILHSQDADAIDAGYLSALAIDLCKAADITRTETTATARLTDDKLVGYEIRCRISKLDAFRKQLQVDESVESTSSLIARLRGKPANVGSTGAEGPQPSYPQNAGVDCSKPTMAATTVGGGGCQ